MNRANQKALALTVGFPLFLISLVDFPRMSLLWLSIWLWGLYAPLKDE